MSGPAVPGPGAVAEAPSVPAVASPQRIDRHALVGPPRSRAPVADVSTHWERERLARALAIAGWQIVPALARTARSFVDCQGWLPFGYTRLSDFCRAQLHRSARWARDLASLGAGLDRFPGLEQAFTGDDGARPLGRVAALCIVRTATEPTFRAWLHVARRVTVRELVDVARQVRRSGGDRPPAAFLEEMADVFQAAEAGGGPHCCRTADVSQPNGATSAGATAIRSPDSLSSFEPTGVVEAEDDSIAWGEARLALPEAVDVAVDEVLDLHRAVSGGEASLSSFVEAMVGEACAGPHPPEAELVVLRRATDQATRERGLERANGRWRLLDAMENEPLGAADLDALTTLEAEIKVALDHLARSQPGAGQADLAAIVQQLVELAQLEHVIQRLLGRLLNTMSRHGDWAQLGFSGVGHYAEERLGMSRRTAECRAGIAAALRLLPQVRRAYERDELGIETAWLLARALGRGPVETEVETEWIDLARRAGVKRVRDEVRRARLVAHIPVAREPDADAELPRLADDEIDLDSIPTSVFERRVCCRIGCGRRQPTAPATDREWLASLQRWPGMTYQRVWRLGRRALTNPSADVLRRFRLPEDLAVVFLSTIESETRRLEQLAADDAWLERAADPTAPPAVVATREYGRRLRRIPSWVGLLSMLEDYARTWDDPRSTPRRQWEKTYEDANYRCMAPGCTARGKIHDHHIEYRSQGGSDEAWNQLALCSAHHLQGEHGRYAQVRGVAPHDVTWRLGIGEFASWWKHERRLDAPLAAARLGAASARRAARPSAMATAPARAGSGPEAAR